MVNAFALRTQLRAEFQNIYLNKIGGYSHYKMDAQGYLFLVVRPQTCFAKFIECAIRFFTRKMSRLEQKFTDITQLLDTWLQVETDEQERTKFLTSHIDGINALLHSANRMKQTGRFVLPSKLHPLINAYIRSNTHSAVNLSSVTCTNNSAGEFLFDFTPKDQEWTNQLSSTSSNPPFAYAPNNQVSAAATASSQVLRMVKVLKKEKIKLDDRSLYQMLIGPQGITTTPTVPTPTSNREITINNTQSNPVTITISSLAQNSTFKNILQVQPNQPQTLNIPDEDLEAEVLHKEQPSAFVLPHQAGRYIFEVDQSENLTLKSTALGVKSEYGSPAIDLNQNEFVLDYTGSHSTNTLLSAYNRTSNDPIKGVVTNKTNSPIEVLIQLDDRSNTLPSLTLPLVTLAPNQSISLGLPAVHSSLLASQFAALQNCPHLECSIDIREFL